MNHTKKRNECRRRNYRKTRATESKRGATHRPWSQEEIDAILTWDLCTDKEISKHFNRSVQAIQQKRYLLKEGYERNDYVSF